jgi:hypothetical protein
MVKTIDEITKKGRKGIAMLGVFLGGLEMQVLDVQFMEAQEMLLKHLELVLQKETDKKE